MLALTLEGLMDSGKIRRMDPEIAARALMGTVQFYFLTTDLLGGNPVKPEEEDMIISGLVSVLLDGLKNEQGSVQT
jgi:hypothetical protein